MEKHSVVYTECISAPASALWKAVADMGDDGQLLTTTSDFSKIVDVARKQTVAFDGVLARTSTKLPLAILLMPQHVVVGAGPSSAHNITSIFDTLSKAIGAQQHMAADFDLDAAAAAAAAATAATAQPGPSSSQMVGAASAVTAACNAVGGEQPSQEQMALLQQVGPPPSALRPPPSALRPPPSTLHPPTVRHRPPARPNRTGDARRACPSRPRQPGYHPRLRRRGHHHRLRVG